MGIALGVVDSSAVLAVLNNEPGADRISEQVRESVISSVSLAEVVTKLADLGTVAAEIDALIHSLNPSVRDFDAALARRCGLLRPITRHLGLSLGDRACLALAQRERLPVYTADRRWAGLDIGIEVRVVR